MAEYWPSSFFACLWTRVKVHKLAKKEQVQYPTILTKQTWAIKNFLYGFRENFSCGTQWIVLSGHLGEQYFCLYVIDCLNLKNDILQTNIS